MFLQDFVPESLDEFIINRESADYLKKNKGITNTVYGPNGVGKFTIAK